MASQLESFHHHSQRIHLLSSFRRHPHRISFLLARQGSGFLLACQGSGVLLACQGSGVLHSLRRGLSPSRLRSKRFHRLVPSQVLLHPHNQVHMIRHDANLPNLHLGIISVNFRNLLLHDSRSQFRKHHLRRIAISRASIHPSLQSSQQRHASLHHKRQHISPFFMVIMPGASAFHRVPGFAHLQSSSYSFISIHNNTNKKVNN